MVKWEEMCFWGIWKAEIIYFAKHKTTFQNNQADAYFLLYFMTERQVWCWSTFLNAIKRNENY